MDVDGQECGEAVCPRCGYDLAGVVASWRESCPLGTVCSECGLGIDCREVMNPVFAVQAGLFEHALRRRGRALVRTAWRACWPWRFWGWVRMVHEVRVGRMVVGAVLGAVLAYVAAVVVGMIAGAGAVVLEEMRAGGNRLTFFSWGQFVTALALRLMWPIGDITGLASGWWGNFQLLYPAAAVGVVAGQLMPLTFLLLPETLQRARVRRVHLVRIWAYSWIGMMPLLVGFGLLGLLNASWFWYDLFPGGHEFWRRYTRAMGLGVVLLWLMVWWGVAAGRYLRLPRAMGVAGAMTAISGMAAMVVVLVFQGHRLVDDLGLW